MHTVLGDAKFLANSSLFVQENLSKEKLWKTFRKLRTIGRDHFRKGQESQPAWKQNKETMVPQDFSTALFLNNKAAGVSDMPSF